MGAALGVAATKKLVNSAFLGHIGLPFLWLFASCVVSTTVTRISAGADAGIADSEASGGGDATGSDTAWTCAEIPRARLLIRQDEHVERAAKKVVADKAHQLCQPQHRLRVLLCCGRPLGRLQMKLARLFSFGISCADNVVCGPCWPGSPRR